MKNQETKEGAQREVKSSPVRGTAAEKKNWKRTILRDVGVSLGVTVALILFNSVVENTVWGRLFEEMTYNGLQLRLQSAGTGPDLPITVVDIGDIEPETRSINGEKIKIFPRKTLQDIIAAIAKHEPLAIGVDADFSPDPSGRYVDPQNDPDFLEFCKGLAQQGVPVFLGVDRRLHVPQSRDWLGSADYKPLAVTIRIPADRRRMPQWIKVRGADAQMDSLGAALAERYRVSLPETPSWWQPFLVRLSTLQSSQFSAGEFLVDYTAIDALRDTAIRALGPQDVEHQGPRFTGKAVLLGEVGHAALPDVFVAPGKSQPYAGALIHASSAYTLINGPLYQLTTIGRVWLDFWFVFFVILVLVTLRLWYEGKGQKAVAVHRVQTLLTLVAVALVILAGAVLVNTTRVIWDDFLFVALALLLHLFFERSVQGMGRWGRLAQRVFHEIILERKRLKES